MSYFDDFDFYDYNDQHPTTPSRVKLSVGNQYTMRVDGRRGVRVLLTKAPELDLHQELRAEAIVLEDNPYLRAGALCRPLAFTLVELGS